MGIAFLCILGFVVVAMIVARSTRDERISMPGDAPAAGADASVDDMSLAGRKIEAIKLLREETRLGLKDAKEEVERRTRQMASSTNPATL